MPINAGDLLAEQHVAADRRLPESMERVHHAVVIADAPAVPRPLIWDTMA